MSSEQTNKLREEYKLIAEFLGFTYSDSTEKDKDPGWYRSPENNGREQELLYYSKTSPLFITRKTLQLNFRHSWDRLMLVVERIEALKHQRYGGFKVTIEQDSCIIKDKNNVKVQGYHRLTNRDTKKKATYDAVVSFIEFWNQIKK